MLDVATGNRIAGPLTNTRYTPTPFAEDGRLAFHQFQTLRPGQPRSDSFLNQRTLVWDLKTDPIAVAGATAGAGPPMRATESAELSSRAVLTDAILSIADGVRKNSGFTLPRRRMWRRPMRVGVCWWTATPASRVRCAPANALSAEPSGCADLQGASDVAG